MIKYSVSVMCNSMGRGYNFTNKYGPMRMCMPMGAHI